MTKEIRPLSLRENTLWNSIGCLIYLGCQWLITVLVVVLSSNYQYAGELAMCMAVGNIFAPIALYRIRAYQVSDVDNRFSTQNYVAFRLITIAGAVLVTFIYCLITQVDMFLLVLVGVYLLFKADEAFSDVLYGVDQRNYRMDYIGVSQVARGLFSLTAFVVCLVLFDNMPVAIIAMAISCMLVTFFYDISHAGRFGSIRPVISATKVIELARTCFPAVLSLLFCSAIVSVCRQYFEYLNGGFDLGIYASVAAPSILIQVSASYLYNPAITRISELYAKRNAKALLSYVLKLTVAIIVAISVLCILAFFFGEWLLVLVYGSSIAPYVYLLLPLCIATGLLGLFWFAMDILVVLRRQARLLLASVAALLVCLGAAIPVISNFGMQGINIVLLCSYFAGLVLAAGFIVSIIYKDNET